MGAPTLEPLDPRENESYRVTHGLVHVPKDKCLYSLRDSPVPDIVRLDARPAVVGATTMRTLRPRDVRAELESPLVTAALMARPRSLAELEEDRLDASASAPSKFGSTASPARRGGGPPAGGSLASSPSRRRA